MSSKGAAITELRGKVAIVGIGATPQGELEGRRAIDNAADAFDVAIGDAGLERADIDGLITCKSIRGDGVDTEIGHLLGLETSYAATLDYGSCNFSIQLAAMAIATGQADYVALTYGADLRTGQMNFALPMGDPTASLSGYVHMAGPAALAFRRHQHLYGTREDQLGHIAVNQRANAALNPLAIFTAPLTIDDYMDSPYVVAPLRRPDLTMVSDGGVSLIMTSAERARDLKNVPVYLLSTAQTSGFGDQHQGDHLMRPWIRRVADALYGPAEMSPEDIDILYIQDPTSVWVLQMLEWYGFCPVGEAGPFLEEGHISLSGRVPLNTNGGQLSESYMLGWLHVHELVKQLRGNAGQRQVPNPSTALYASTMAFQKAAASIFGISPCASPTI